MHPHDAKDVGADELRALRELTLHPKVIACWRDRPRYYYIIRRTRMQRRVFAQFIHMARETGLPIVVHERDAAQEVAELLAQRRRTGIAQRSFIAHRQL